MAINALKNPFALNRFGRSGAISRFTLLAIILGFLPVLSGVVLRSYGHGIQPVWLESLRMMDFPDIFAEALIIMWARRQGLDFGHYWRMFPRHIKVASAVFLSTFWIGAVFISPITSLSIIRSGYWIVHLGFGLSVYHLIKTSVSAHKIDVKHFVNWQVAGVTILAIITALYFAHIAQLPASYADQIKWAGAVPGFMSVRQFGILTGSVAALYAGYFCWTLSRGFNLSVAMLIFTLLMGLTIWSGTRAAVVGFAGAFFLLALATKSLPPATKAGAIVLSAFFGFWLSAPLLPPSEAFGFFQIFDTATQTNLDEVSSGRLTIWHFVWTLFLEHWAFGWGEGAMNGMEITGMTVQHIQPHNAILQFLYSWGIFAASAMFVIIGSVILRLHLKVGLNHSMAGPLMMADALLIMALFDGVLFFSRMIMPLVFCLALCLAIEGKSSNAADSAN